MDFDKTYNWKVHFMFISGGQEAAGQCYIVAKNWDEVCLLAKEAPFMALAEATTEEEDERNLHHGIRPGEPIERFEILGIEKINATLVEKKEYLQ